MTGETRETTTATARRAWRIGTCGSDLAKARARDAGEKITRTTGTDFELVVAPDAAIPAQALRKALLAGDCDIVVHALADVPGPPHPGLVIGAVPERGDARDVLCARGQLMLAELPAASRVGVDCARRVAQLKAARSDIEAVEVHGTVASRLAMVQEGELDAVVLDAAGLDRLGLLDAVTEFFELSAWPTTPGQGALALEVRAEDARNISLIRAMLTKLDHRMTRIATTAERAVLAYLPDSAAPLAASALVDSGLLLLSATVYSVNDGGLITSSRGVVLDGMSPAESKVAVQELGRTVANELLRRGARELVSLGSDS